jgi:protein TonB
MNSGTPSAGGIVGSRNGVRMIDTTPPPYPVEARLRGIEGRTVVRVSIAADGSVTDAKVEVSSGYAILDKAAVDYAKTRRFIPARLDNVPVATTVLHPVSFGLGTSQ